MACSRRFLIVLGLVGSLAAPWPVARCEEISEDMVGQSAPAWEAWQAAVKALERDDAAQLAKQLEQLATMRLSDLRLALMADRTGSIRLEELAKTAEASEVVKETVNKINNGRRQKALAEDGWHFAAIGRFNYADANFKALDESNPDPVALLELARQNPNRQAILVKLVASTEVGPSARRFIEWLNRGEEMLRTDANEIAVNIRKLGGPPRMNFNAANRLKESGEYAVPQLLQHLQDPARKSLHAAILQLLPQMGRDAMNPLCVALSMNDNVIRQVASETLAKIGYRQAVPYLAKLASDAEASSESRTAAKQALASLGQTSEASLGALFHELAEAYWSNLDSVKADPRHDMANVWYLRENELRVIAVPTTIFNDIMTMRCCEEALKSNPDQAESTALWIAANLRREAKLGMNVESEKPDALADKDGTRPEHYPRSIYFARAAGAMYNQMVLARACKSREPGVALGAIAALAETAGEPNLIAGADGQQPLVQTLSFPNRQVRIKAALALGRALPKKGFYGADNVVPVLAEALSQSGRSSALIVDPDSESANKVAAVMRGAGFDCAVGATVAQAREQGTKDHLTSYDAILLASDIAQPDVMAAVNDLRRDPGTAATPIVIVAKSGQMPRATQASRLSGGVEIALADVLDMGDPEKIREQVMSRVNRAASVLGMTPLSAEMSLSLALEAADVLRAIAESRSKVLDASRAAGALVVALSYPSETLRIRAAHALALLPGADGQAALAKAALDTAHGHAERLAEFASLAESARRNGNLLGGELVDQLIAFTLNEQDLVLRAAASKALGALNLAGNKASEIIRTQYRG